MMAANNARPIAFPLSNPLWGRSFPLSIILTTKVISFEEPNLVHVDILN